MPVLRAPRAVEVDSAADFDRMGPDFVPRRTFVPRLDVSLTAIAIACAALATPLVAAAQQPQQPRDQTEMAQGATEQQMDQEARDRFRLGRTLYDGGRFREAAREFEAAYQLSHRSELLFNIYVAYRDASDLQHATDALRQYIEAKPDAPNITNLRARLQTMEEALSRGEQGVPTESAGQGAAAGGSTQGTTQPATEPVGGTTEGAPATQPPPSGGGSNVLGWVVTGTGAALLVAGAITGILVLGKVSDLETMCPMDECPSSDFETLRDDTQPLVTLTDVLLIAGGVVTAVGVGLLLFGGGGGGGSERASSARTSVSAACTGDGCAASLSWRL